MLAALFGIVCAVCGFIVGWNYGKTNLLEKLAHENEISVETYKTEMDKLL